MKYDGQPGLRGRPQQNEELLNRSQQAAKDDIFMRRMKAAAGKNPLDLN